MIFTFILYNFILIFGTLFAYMSTLIKEMWGKKFFIFLSFLTLFVPAALRYGVGTDYLGYESIFNEILFTGSIEKTEPFYGLLNQIVIFFTGSFHWVIVLSSLLTFVFVYKSVVHSKQIFLTILLFVLLLYLYSFSTVRQSLAIVISMFATFRLFNDDKALKFVFCILLGAMFHYSALLMLLVLPFRKLKFNLLFGLLILVVFFFLGKFLSTSVLNSPLLEATKYGGYASNKFGEETEIGSGLGVFLNILPVLIVMILVGWRFEDGRKKFFLFNLGLIYLLTKSLALNIHILGRINEVFGFVPIILIVYFVEIEASLRLKRIIQLFCVFCYLILFEKSIAVNTIDIGGGLGISPYVSIFSLI